MANHDISSDIEYHECAWGDCIKGTKEQLQGLGLGVGLVWPGEPGGPKYEMRARDPRGYPVRISKRYNKEGIFTADVEFPDWPERPEPEWNPVFAGVKKREHTWNDEYIGTAEALVAADLARVGQFPGQPGMRKTRVTILPDGSLRSGASREELSLAKSPGAREVERATVSLYRVFVYVTDDEVSRRWAVFEAAQYERSRKIRALPRPRRLEAGMTSQKQNHHARGNLCLVWSAA